MSSFYMLSTIFITLFYFLKQLYLAMHHGLWNLNILTRNQTHTPLHWKHRVFLFVCFNCSIQMTTPLWQIVKKN